MAQREVVKLLQQYIVLLNTSGIIVNKAFLYGSYSLNNANKNSDIDIMIVSENRIYLILL